MSYTIEIGGLRFSVNNSNDLYKVGNLLIYKKAGLAIPIVGGKLCLAKAVVKNMETGEITSNEWGQPIAVSGKNNEKY